MCECKCPDQVPGRTITESEYRHAMLAATDTEDFDAEELLRRLGLTVVPDPDPTNAEKLAIYLGLHDLDALTQAGVAEFAQQLDADGVKAPGGDDD